MRPIQIMERYDRVEVIGSGSFGKAWLAMRVDTGRKYVLKEVHVLGMKDKERKQALTEVTALARCKHINVIRYKEAFVHQTALWIAMEYADRGDLYTHIKSQPSQSLPQAVVLDWFVQICFALQYIHNCKIIHRDLKTQNIFLTSSGVIKVGDLGIARILKQSEAHANTAVGTPYYLSPEICKREPYDYKTDMWAAGCVVYEMCTGRRPFQTDHQSFSALVLNIIQGKYKPLPQSCGPILEDLVHILLKVNPENRPSADQTLAIPALQRYVSTYIERTRTFREQCATSTPRCPRAINKLGNDVITSPATRSMAVHEQIPSPTTLPRSPQTEAKVLSSKTSPSRLSRRNKDTAPQPYRRHARKYRQATPLPPTDRLSTPPSPPERPATPLPPHDIPQDTFLFVDKQSSPLSGDKQIVPEAEDNIPKMPPRRKASLGTPKPSPLVSNKRIAQSAKSTRATENQYQGRPSPAISLYHEVLRKRRPLATLATKNTPIPRGMTESPIAHRTRKRSSPDKQKNSQDALQQDVYMCHLLTCTPHVSQAHSNMETVRDFLESRLGQDRLLEMLNKVKEQIELGDNTYISRICSDVESKTCFPLVVHLLQLEHISKNM